MRHNWWLHFFHWLFCRYNTSSCCDSSPRKYNKETILALSQNYDSWNVTFFISSENCNINPWIDFCFQQLSVGPLSYRNNAVNNTYFEFQWFVLSDHFMTKTASNVNHVVKAATKTRKARPAAKYAAREWQPSDMERLTVTGASSVRLHFTM